MLTAAGDLSDRVEGLDLGADDYLAKPFAFAELAARVRALGRRAGRRDPPVLERAGIRLDQARHEATRYGRPLSLRHKEFAVLAELLRGEGAVVSAEQLLEKAWDENIDPFTHVVRVTIMTLRRKLGDPPAIDTIPGAGYRIRESAPSAPRHVPAGLPAPAHRAVRHGVPAYRRRADPYLLCRLPEQLSVGQDRRQDPVGFRRTCRRRRCAAIRGQLDFTGPGTS